MHRRRYFWAALACLAIGGLSIAALRLVDVTDTEVQGALNLFFQAAGAVAAVLSVVLAVVGLRRERPPQAAAAEGSSSAATSTHRGSYLEVRDADQSLRTYVEQMQAVIGAHPAQPKQFVELSAVSEPSARHEPVLTPRLELITLESEPRSADGPVDVIDLSAIADGFMNGSRHVALLGEPGSGKSTCLLHLAAAELGRISGTSLDAAGLEAGQHRLPLYVTLSEWQNQRLGAMEFLKGQVEKLVGTHNYYHVRFEDLLADGRFLLLLDGLNELPNRTANPREGSHEQDGHKDGLKSIVDRFPGRFDQREESLRELARTAGLRCAIILTCRSHEYFPSQQWKAVRLLPMTEGQIGSFLDAYLEPAHADELRDLLKDNPVLGAMASNPFFLQMVVATARYDPDFAEVSRRGQLLEFLYLKLLGREQQRKRELGQPTADEPEITRVIGRCAFSMIERGAIGNQAPLVGLAEEEQPLANALADTGLLVGRDERFYFYHQIIQEFFAASALQRGQIRRRLPNLLADKRWSQVVALCYDLDSQRMHPRLLAAMRARNLPWRRPRSKPGPMFLGYQLLSTVAVFLVASAYLVDWLLWPLQVLPLPFGLPAPTPLALVAALVGIRVVWSTAVRHQNVLVNNAYVLAVSHDLSAIHDIIPCFGAFTSIWQPERVELAQNVARFGPSVIRPLREQLPSSRWQVRVGCVQALGQLARNGQATNPEVVEPLLAVAAAGDPQMTGSAIEALRYCRDPRIMSTLADAINQVKQWHPWMVMVHMQPLVRLQSVEDWSTVRDGLLGPEVLELYERLRARDQPFPVRVLAVRATGRLRLPGTHGQLRRIAEDRTEDANLRKAAVIALGELQTPEAVELLGELAEGDAIIEATSITALRSVSDNAALPALRGVAGSWFSPVREAVAVAAGRLCGPEVLPLLERLADDKVEQVRVAAAHALGATGDSRVIPLLTRLAHDQRGSVRTAAVDALIQQFPEQAPDVLTGMAADPTNPARVRAIRLLAGYADPGVLAALQPLTADSDRAIRAEAQTAKQRVEEAMRGSKVGRPKLRGAAGAVRSLVGSWLELDGLAAMRREERLNGTPSAQMFNRIYSRIIADAELSRRFRRALWVATGAVYVALVLLGLVAVLLLRLAVWASAVVLDHWQLFGVLVLLAAASLLPRVRRLAGKRFVGPAVWLLWVVAAVVVVLVMIGGLIYTWWIWLGPLALVLLALRLGIMRHRRRRRRLVRAALETGPEVAVSGPGAEAT